jgi:DNA polymerase-3 subunit beta
MKCVVARSALNDAAKMLAAATGRSSVLPIVNYILFEAREDNTLRMAATNLTLWLEWTIAAEVEETGKVAVAGKELRALIATLPDQWLTLGAPSDLETIGRMTLEFDGGTYKLPVLPADEFPLPPEEVTMREPIQVNGHRLAEALRKVMFAASTDPTTGILTGVHFRKEEGDEYLDIVATDTYRLALFRLEDENFPTMNLTLPTSALKVLLPLIDKTATVKWRLLISALAGTYVNYRRIIPDEFMHQVRMRVDDILPALRRLTIFKPRSPRIPFRIILRFMPDNLLEITAVDVDMGSWVDVAKEVVRVDWFAGLDEPYIIAFQHPYIAEFLSLVRSGEVVVNLRERKQATLWLADGEPNWRYVVMPMHLPGESE